MSLTSKKCTFCNNPIKVGRGIMFVKNDSNILYICSDKCKKNIRLGRDPRRLKWTGRYVKGGIKIKGR